MRNLKNGGMKNITKPQSRGFQIDEAYDRYCDSHITPGNPKGATLGEQLMSVRPISHSRESFKTKLQNNIVFRIKWLKR